MKKNGRLLIHKAGPSFGTKVSYSFGAKKSAISSGASTTRLIIYFCNAELFLSDMVISDFLHKHHLLNLHVANVKFSSAKWLHYCHLFLFVSFNTSVNQA